MTGYVSAYTPWPDGTLTLDDLPHLTCRIVLAIPECTAHKRSLWSRLRSDFHRKYDLEVRVSHVCDDIAYLTPLYFQKWLEYQQGARNHGLLTKESPRCLKTFPASTPVSLKPGD